MLTIDYITLGIMGFALLVGILFGFRKTANNLLTGWLGSLASAVVAIAVFDLIYASSVGVMFHNWVIGNLLSYNNGFANFLVRINIDKAALFLLTILVFVVMGLLLEHLLTPMFESENKVARFFSVLTSVVVTVSAFFVLYVFALNIVYWVDGGINGGVYQYLKGSLLKIDDLYLFTPAYIFK